jgi:DnaJ like chaperone protein
MSAKFAKWIGGTLGWALGGPIGGLVGFSLGALWDNATLSGSLLNSSNAEGQPNSTHRGDFYISLLVLAAAMMKADNKVLKSELNYVKQFLQSQFGVEHSNDMLKVLKDLLEKEITLEPVCIQIRGHMTHAQRLQLIHFLIGIAKADGQIHELEWKLLKTVSNYLYINSKDLDSLTAMYQVDDDRYYRILEIEKTATQDEIKSAYRKMAKKYHPDKLGDIGEEARKAGNEKFRQVQEAYENLYKQ